uniref:Uncharacterized protein n=1 Tax=Chrysotila carterae TaxID=13221 RepID=A0A7S4C2E7_CHRCT|mmetsp:Transcript_29036/g.60935  ORF Transcript_29036/g.60935 Transcript_29036/m.60935 type:complete len:203 (-) Transcript_29036:481-1089(-)|eukprot:6186565-Pleurochrysis_carterae.AAC.2
MASRNQLLKKAAPLYSASATTLLPVLPTRHSLATPLPALPSTRLASDIFSQLLPYTPVACCVLVQANLGIAISDPYLSRVDFTRVSRYGAGAAVSAARVLRSAQVGGVVFARQNVEREGWASQAALARVVRRHLDFGLPFCFWKQQRPTHELLTDPHSDMLECVQAIGTSSTPALPLADALAALLLQEALDVNVGAWKNTFG